MKLAQEPAFSPIALIFETAGEAEAFWSVIRNANGCNQFEREIIRKISDLFSNEAHL